MIDSGICRSFLNLRNKKQNKKKTKRYLSQNEHPPDTRILAACLCLLLIFAWTFKIKNHLIFISSFILCPVRIECIIPQSFPTHVTAYFLFDHSHLSKSYSRSFFFVPFTAFYWHYESNLKTCNAYLIKWIIHLLH